jgi:hypothetical protein
MSSSDADRPTGPDQPAAVPPPPPAPSPAPSPAGDHPTTPYSAAAPAYDYAQQQPYPPYPYGTAAPVAPPTDDKAVWALVSAIAGFFLCPIVLHIVGWVLASSSLAAIRASGGTLGGDGMAKAARIISIIGLVLYGGLILLVVFFGILGFLAVPASVGTGGIGT